MFTYLFLLEHMDHEWASSKSITFLVQLRPSAESFERDFNTENYQKCKRTCNPGQTRSSVRPPRPNTLPMDEQWLRDVVALIPVLDKNT